MLKIKQWKGFISGIIFTLVIMALSGVVFATVTGTSITVYYDNIKILLNGKEIETKDINGNEAEPFIYNGTTYVPIRAVSQAFNKIVEWDADSKCVKIYETEIDKFWDNFVSDNRNENNELNIYWRYIDGDVMENTDKLIEKYGAEVLFQGLKSTNLYSQYYCINRLVEYYNYDEIRSRAIVEITPFLKNDNNTIKHGAEFAISVLSKNFDSPHIVKGADDIKIFTLFNNYSDYGSYHEIWMIKNDKLSKFYSFTESHMYIQLIKLSPNKSKIAVQTSTRRSNSFHIIDINDSKKISPELMLLALLKVASDNPDYNNTYAPGGVYAGGEYCFGGSLKWVDNNTVEFEADLAYDYMEIIEQVIIRYNVSDNSIEYKSK